MGKLTISMAIFNSYLKLPEGRYHSVNIVTFFPCDHLRAIPATRFTCCQYPWATFMSHMRTMVLEDLPTFAQHKSPSFVGFYIPAPWFAYGFGFDSKPTCKTPDPQILGPSDGPKNRR